MSHAYDPGLDDPLPDVDRETLLRRLESILPPDALLREEEQRTPFECDGLPAYRSVPLVVVLPGTVDEVKAVLALCHELGVPVVTRGAGTGVSGGALPCETGVLLVLTRLGRILEIDPENRLARVQPGVRNLAISEATAEYGLYYAPDPSSQIACSIGGNVAENAGGIHCLKYGLTVHNILKLELLTLKGEEVTIGGDSLDSPGFDLLAPMIGSEGMLGVVVEITVKLLVIPPETKTFLAAFDDVTVASRAVADIIGAGIIPAALEMMDKLALIAAEDYTHAGYPTDAEALLIVELDGHALEVDAEVARTQEVLKRAGATEVRLAKSAAERELFWKGRKSAFGAMGRISTDYYCIDGTIPRHAIGDVLNRIAALSKEYGLGVANVFHAGDGNLHPLILFDANKPGDFEQVEKLGARILETCIDVGGTITGEHGVGREKIGPMAYQFTDAEIEQFHRLKAVFDPKQLLNPGKAIPTLKRCQEYRAISGRRGPASQT